MRTVEARVATESKGRGRGGRDGRSIVESVFARPVFRILVNGAAPGRLSGTPSLL